MMKCDLIQKKKKKNKNTIVKFKSFKCDSKSHENAIP